MRKIFVLSIAIMLMINVTNSSAFFYKTLIIINQMGGALVQSPAGNYVGYTKWEYHNPAYHLGYDAAMCHILNCQDPGLERCEWRTKPSQFATNPIEPDNSDLEDYANEHIANGLFSGTYNTIVSIENTIFYRILTWDSDPLNDMKNITISIYTD